MHLRLGEYFSLSIIQSALVLLLLFCVTASAERLPLKIYTTSDGLADNLINKIVRDTHGFLWFCTQEGLSRFDGYGFTNYGTNEGLPDPTVNDIIETRNGNYWVATNGGLVLFNPKGTPSTHVVNTNDDHSVTASMFTTILPEDSDRHARAINVLLEDQDGTIWCGTLKGLYRLDPSGKGVTLRTVDLPMPSDHGELRYVNDIVQDRFGSLWIASPSGLYRRWVDGRTARYTVNDGLPANFLHDLLLDHQQNLWVASRDGGLFRINYNDTLSKPTVAFTLVPKDFIQSEWINQLFETSDHKLWAATAQGLLEVTQGSSKPYQLYTSRNGLSGHDITTLGEDAGGNLWLASASGTGAMKLVHRGFITYDEQDGVNSVFSVFADYAGGVCFRGYVLGDKDKSIFEGGEVALLDQSRAALWPQFGRFDGHNLSWFVPDVLKKKYFGWVDEGVTLQTRSKEWWVATGGELYRFPPQDSFVGIAHARPLSIFGKDSALAGRQVFRLFEDSHERVWISTVVSSGNGLAIWDRATQTLRALDANSNLPSLQDDLPRSFGEDLNGNVWIGFNTGIVRFHDGVFVKFGSNDGLPKGSITSIYTDPANHVWLGSARGGLIRMDQPNADKPTFATYSMDQGLSSNVVMTVTGDNYGHIYLGTGRGLDRLDSASGRVRHYTTADGIAGGEIKSVFCGPDRSVWVGTKQGVSKLLSEPDPETTPAPVMVTSLHVGGAVQPLSALGETEITLADVPASASQLQIEFVGLDFAPGESLLYQYKLEGSDTNWSVPTTQRNVTYARVAPGRYHFLVRTINADGEASTKPATIVFRVLPPVWLRWWFISLVVLLLAGAAFVLYRFRIARLLEVANMRTRIATDLHDDIGANLTKIAILSEIVKQQSSDLTNENDTPLSSIARIARESVSSMNDIVWAINPQRDHLMDLVRRMRREAQELFAASDIELAFQAPGEDQDLKLSVDMRRDFFLIFKEAINNAARHAKCRHVSVEFHVDARLLSLRITDDGMGFNVGEAEGHGLENMRQRVEGLGGTIKIDSRVHEGTCIDVDVPRTPPRLVFSQKTVVHPV